MQASHRFLGLALVAACLTFASSLVTTNPASAQDAAPAEAPATDAAATEEAAPAADGKSAADAVLESRRNESFLVWMIRASGVFGFLIFLVSFVMVSLIVMQMLQLRRDNYIPQAFIEDFERLLNEKNYQGAYEAAKGNDSFIGKVLAAGMSRLSRGYEDALQGMSEAGEEESLAMEQNIGYLALIASVGPMLGLLGTVQGMVASFQVIATSVVAPKPYELADGIATALFTTLEGLTVAIPAMIFYSIFKNRLARFIMEAGFISEELMKRFQGMGKQPSPAAPRPAAAAPAPAAAAPPAPAT